MLAGGGCCLLHSLALAPLAAVRAERWNERGYAPNPGTADATGTVLIVSLQTKKLGEVRVGGQAGNGAMGGRRAMGNGWRFPIF